MYVWLSPNLRANCYLARTHDSARKTCNNLRFRVHSMFDFLFTSDTNNFKLYEISFSGKLHTIYMRTGFDEEVKRISHWLYMHLRFTIQFVSWTPTYQLVLHSTILISKRSAAIGTKTRTVLSLKLLSQLAWPYVTNFRWGNFGSQAICNATFLT